MKKTRRFDLVKFDEIIEYIQNLNLLFVASFILIHCYQFKRSIDMIVLLMKEKNDESSIDMIKSLLSELKEKIHLNESFKQIVDIHIEKYHSEMMINDVFYNFYKE